MEILKDSDIQLKFLLGLPVSIEGVGNFFAPLVNEVVNLTEDTYYMSINATFFDKKQLENQEGLDEYTDFQVLSSIILFDQQYLKMFLCGLILHLDTEPILHSDGHIYFSKVSEETKLTEEKFNYIKRLIKIANNINEKPIEEEYKAGNERAKKFLEKLKRQREEINKVKKQKINLHSIISAVGWKAQSFDFIGKLNIYQLYDGFYRLGVIDEYNHIMTGIYTGNIDASKIKLPDINWANIIKIN